ncbi:hypothetical protein XELAEV_18001310mg [Xenopus laevis]|nr:hypothetical protein XELAEV_18001310mg [Xenopus laevis]
MHLALEEDLSHSTDIQWILGGLAISIVAFLLGCAICRQKTNSHSSYVNVEPEPSYENVDNSPSKNLRPLKDHTYLELIAGDETTTETLTNLDVKRNALKKSGKSLSIPESLSNSYENVTQQGSPANSELNPDYVNM